MAVAETVIKVGEFKVKLCMKQNFESVTLAIDLRILKKGLKVSSTEKSPTYTGMVLIPQCRYDVIYIIRGLTPRGQRLWYIYLSADPKHTILDGKKSSNTPIQFEAVSNMMGECIQRIQEISLCCRIALTRTSSTILNRSENTELLRLLGKREVTFIALIPFPSSTKLNCVSLLENVYPQRNEGDTMSVCSIHSYALGFSAYLLQEADADMREERGGHILSWVVETKSDGMKWHVLISIFPGQSGKTLQLDRSYPIP
ncbi:hypothetical protein STEG23_026914, partial [Scotinomys teguina]